MHLFFVAMGPLPEFPCLKPFTLISLGDAVRGIVARGKKADERNEKSGYKFATSLTTRNHENHCETSLSFLISLLFSREIFLEASWDRF
jgi:hypothetical protein